MMSAKGQISSCVCVGGSMQTISSAAGAWREVVTGQPETTYKAREAGLEARGLDKDRVLVDT